MAVIFNLDKPLSKQIKEAEEALKDYYKKTGREPYPRQRLISERFRLLRTLDAHAANASWQEIATLNLADKTPQAVRDKLNQARNAWRKIQINSQ